jgi:hypothetical protein
MIAHLATADQLRQHLDTKSLTAKEILLAVLKDDPGLLLELRHLLVKNPA